MTEDTPQDFFDMSWLAVKGGDPDGIAEILELSTLAPATWTQGIHAVIGDFWDFEEDVGCHNTRVFMSPLVEGWRLVVGGWLGGSGDKDFRAIAEHCRVLSDRYGAAHAFTTQGRLGFYSWTLAESGSLRRIFVFNGDPLIDEGTPPGIELQLKETALAEGNDGLWPREASVMSMASAFSIAPADLGPHCSSVGRGFMFATTWGKTHGLPRRPLCECRNQQATCHGAR